MAKPFRVQDRDLRFFEELAGCGGLLDSRTIHDRYFSADCTGEACRRRLNVFCDHHLLEQYRPAVTFGAAPTGRRPAVYRLTPKGAAFIHEMSGELPPVTSNGLSALTLEHRLGMAKLRLLVNDACVHENLPTPKWIGEYDPWPAKSPPADAKLSQRFRLCHQYEEKGVEVTWWPDAASLISVPGDASTMFELLVLWEYDRSTERIAQVKNKLPGLEIFLKRHDGRRLFEGNDPSVIRVFLVTKSVERRNNLAEAIRHEPGGGVVRLAVVEDLSSTTLFRASIWFTPSGEARSIIMPK